MNNFEEITKDTETLAKFITMLDGVNSDCYFCLVKNECKELVKVSKTTYRLCTRAWCTWLNKEV